MAGSVVVGLFSIFIFYLGVGGRWNLRGEGRGRCREKEGGRKRKSESEKEGEGRRE